jgi:GntR family transcriptional regulator
MPRFLFQAFPTSGVPIYRQLINQVRRQAAAGRLQPGEFLPSVREVAGELQVNPMTVSKAYSILEREGVVEMVRGQGMRLKAPSANGTVRDRRQSLKPLLEQVVATAFQLSLSPRDVMQLLEPMLEDLDRE